MATTSLLVCFFLFILVVAFIVQGYKFRVTVERMGERFHNSLEEQRDMTVSLFDTINSRLDFVQRALTRLGAPTLSTPEAANASSPEG